MELQLEWRVQELESINVVLLTNSGDLIRVAEEKIVSLRITNQTIILLVTQSSEHLSESIANSV